VPDRVALLDDLTFDTLFNVRDLGGYEAADGASIRAGQLYRADGVHRASAADLERLLSLGLRTVIDLRTPAELEVARFAVDGTDVAWHHLPVIAEIWESERVSAIADDDEAVRFLVDRYVDMTAEGGRALAAALSIISDAEGHPALFHCAAGKDRTGVLAAIVLALLGVDDEVIADDYSRSAVAMERLREWFIANDERVASIRSKQPPVFRAAPRDAMLGFLREIEVRYGSVADYVRSIGVDDQTLAQLRAALLT
jgi:protein-tyrosine phosphatase